jgi:DNA invertase Pin-like site-specific DNA recombinase
MAQKSNLKAVFYARVSTEEEKQVNALVQQVQENKDVIMENGWELVDQYVDEGKSGTQTKKRDEYNRLLEDLEKDKFDIIVIKSQDRLMRNTKDWYVFIDKLVTSGKRLYMYLDGNFYTPDNSLISGIKAILAEEYSRELSKKINNANNRRLEKAKKGEAVAVYGSSRCYGYDMANGKQTINEEQADVVRMIYRLYLEGNGGRAIRRELTARGITNHDGKEMNEVTILNILKNEKYIGTLVTNKSHKDFETKKTVKNPPEDWVRIPDAIPAIVTKEDFKVVSEILNSHRLEAGTEKRAKTIGKNVGKKLLSGKIFCGNCGSLYWGKKRTDNGKLTWICSTYAKMGKKSNRRNENDLNVEVDMERGCNSTTLYDEDVMEIISIIGNDLSVNRDAVKASMLKWLNILLDNVSSEEEHKNLVEALQKQEKLKNKLLDALLEDIISKEDYKKKSVDIENRIKELRRIVTKIESQSMDSEEIRRVIANIDNEIDEWIGTEDFNHNRIDFILKHLNRITVSGEHLIIELDLFRGAIIAGSEFLQYVKEEGTLF